MLLQLPLLQGMSKAELSEVVEKVKFHFQRFNAGTTLFSQGAPCDKIIFLLQGEVEAATTAPNAAFTFAERHTQPMTIELHSLFGISPHFKATYTALTDVALVTIDKAYIYSALEKYEVFRMNLFNQLSHRAQQLHAKVWSITPQDLEGRLASLIRSLCTTERGTKILRIRMDHLAQLLGTTRLNISSVLNKWREEGLIEMRRKEYIIHAVERL